MRFRESTHKGACQSPKVVRVAQTVFRTLFSERFFLTLGVTLGLRWFAAPTNDACSEALVRSGGDGCMPTEPYTALEARRSCMRVSYGLV